MGNFRPLRTRCWEAFLTHRGYKHVRTKSSHDQWTKPGSRTIPVWGNETDIPPIHIHKSCKSIGCTMKDVYDWADANC